MKLPKKEVVAMLLAGGQGSRLGVLTKKIAKPAVPFGGKYRIIDFPLSNCTNSGIEAVGVLTQYQPLVLNEYIGNGQPWELDGMHAGVTCLSPYESKKGSEWYSGTANAIYQNISFVDRYNPEYVVILSGDHIYKMDYADMVKFHKEHDAACTIAVIDVPLDEASRFGILNTNEDGSIYEFDEKPEHPKSTNASMGIYVFSWQKLKKYLIEDAENENSSNDFGKDVLPAMLNAGERMFAYPFEGYWKDVGTVESLWNANMDLLDPKLTLDLRDIYSKNPMLPPHFVSDDADVKNSNISDGCMVEGEVHNSILFAGVTVEKGARVDYSIIMPNTVIKAGADVRYSIVSENTVIGKNAHVGCNPEDAQDKDNWGVAVIGDDLNIGDNVVVPPNAMIGEDLEAE
ncbi:MAG: glucose-1-phosphate adenylyltransferase [Ruminococcus sp.]|nr:glucose-1-phosphate adenylyltransferase [Ruminococcus sp.]